MENIVQVGKYTLESLTTGMYSDPKIVYREYIQNSVDSLENAVESGVIEKQSMRIDIVVNDEESYISIRDNGTGIPYKLAQNTLLNVGSSKKHNTNNRGFRGIGRLGGMSYCDTLVFTTSAEGEVCKTVISFDCKNLRELLVPGQHEDLSLSAVLNTITSIEVLPEKREKHYFLVEMKDVIGISDLLNIDAVKSYIAQVAPAPYQSRHFLYATQLKEYLAKHDYNIEEFPIFVGEDDSDLEPVYKPNKSRFHSDRSNKTADEITNIEYFEVMVDGERYAVGWYGRCGWYGTITERDLSGLRIRKGNILIGDNKTLNGIFKEARFNGWTQGEIFVVTDKLVPNARRDDFEQNEAYYKFVETLSKNVAAEISRAIRAASQNRNDPSMKTLMKVDKKVSEATAMIAEGFNSASDKEKLVAELNKSAEKLAGMRLRDEHSIKGNELIEKIEKTIEQVSESKNFKINKINSSVDKKSRQVLKVVSEILSKKLSKFLVDEIIDEIINELNRK